MSQPIVYPLNDAPLQQLRQKARMLGHGTVHVHTLHAGFARIEAH